MGHHKVIWQTAVGVLHRERGEAGDYAGRHALAALDANDTTSHDKWVSVLEAIFELVRPPDDRDTKH